MKKGFIAFSLACLAWILFMTLTHHYNIDIGVIGGILWEMLTIPVFLMIALQIIVYGVLWVKNGFKMREEFIALVISLISGGIVAFSSINLE